jgi:hypothetical protein
MLDIHREQPLDVSQLWFLRTFLIGIVGGIVAAMAAWGFNAIGLLLILGAGPAVVRSLSPQQRRQLVGQRPPGSR